MGLSIRNVLVMLENDLGYFFEVNFMKYLLPQPFL